ncbi:UNVERIFIED_CONTAM: Dynein regulatory complex subunit 3 [Gekko kuhli]
MTSRLYDSIEPNVIDNEMLQKAVEEQGPKEEAGQLAKREGINFKDVKELQLDFRNILKIDNLWQFVNLTKLQLDNNIIEKIEALESLVHLVWLDLSFNNIEVIEGLSTLVNLKDLSLFNNRISKIENLDALQQLQIFSIGNNNIGTLENLIYLRKFKELRTLNLAGNPVCDNDAYAKYIAAYLPDLVYLDFRMVEDSTKEIAFVKYQYAIEEMKQGEAVALAKQKADEAKQKELDYHKAAYVEYLNGSFLFDSMYAEDPEASKLVYLPGVPELLETYPTCSLEASGRESVTRPARRGLFLDSRPTYKSKFVAICENLFEYGLKQHEKRKAEVALFDECLNEALEDNRKEGNRAMADFEEKRRLALEAIQNASETEILEARLQEYNDDITKLFETLMTMEMQLVDQLECRDLENHHHEKLLEIAINTLEKIVKSEFDEEIPDDVRMLFVDKDTIVNAVNASHDIHLLKIDNREDEIITKANSWASVLIEKVHKSEITRNRDRVKEINQFIDHLHNELETMDIMEQ